MPEQEKKLLERPHIVMVEGEMIDSLFVDLHSLCETVRDHENVDLTVFELHDVTKPVVEQVLDRPLREGEKKRLAESAIPEEITVLPPEIEDALVEFGKQAAVFNVFCEGMAAMGASAAVEKWNAVLEAAESLEEAIRSA